MSQSYVVRIPHARLLGAQGVLNFTREIVAHLNAIPMNYIDSTWPLFVPAKLVELKAKKINSVRHALASAPFSPAAGAGFLT
jgi:hypothetical protein